MKDRFSNVLFNNIRIFITTLLGKWKWNQYVRRKCRRDWCDENWIATLILWAAVIMMIQGVFGKLGAIFILVPDPIVGGMFPIMFGMITAFGISALQYVDLKSSRNLYIIGVSLFFPLVLCP